MSNFTAEIARFVVFTAENDGAARTAIHDGEPLGMRFTATYAQLCALDELLTGETEQVASHVAWEHHEDTSVVLPLRSALTIALAHLDPHLLRHVARSWANTPEGRSSGWNAAYAARMLKTLRGMAGDAASAGRSLYFWSWVNPDLLVLVNGPEVAAHR